MSFDTKPRQGIHADLIEKFNQVKMVKSLVKKLF